MKHLIAATLLLTLPCLADAQEQADNPSNWEISEQSSPLTGVRSIAAVTQATNEIANSLGYAARPSLVLRCGEGGLVIYVNWTEVVNRDSQNVAGSPKTLAIWRIDDGELQSKFWDISSTGTAAGEFKHNNALKLISSLVGARTLAVRLSGRRTQDAGFDLTGIDEIAADIAGACGAQLR